ncbi:MAG TPA: methyltransferase domain-containing protein [Chitinophagaceae bacterium]|nr:methyltransferase domain-containing protein [Chitinophagaceae bacterium]
MHLNSKLLIEKYARPLAKEKSKILEIGPDKFPSTIQNIFGSDHEWHTLNIFNDNRLTFPKSNEYNFPIADSSYNMVISANVIEHVRKIWKWMPELARVVKPGGYVITVNPVSWGYHEDPVDCWRIYPEGMRALCEEAGLKVLHSSFENLESEFYYKRSFNKLKMWPGSTMHKPSLLNKLKLAIGYPIIVSVDTITIAQK